MDIEEESEKPVRVVKYTCEALWWYTKEKRSLRAAGFVSVIQACWRARKTERSS